NARRLRTRDDERAARRGARRIARVSRSAMTFAGSRAPQALLALALAACTANPYYDPAKPHHARDGFRNRYPHADKGSFWEWKFEEWRDGLPAPQPPGGWRFDVVKPDVEFLQANRDVETLTWIGHASFLVQL